MVTLSKAWVVTGDSEIHAYSGVTLFEDSSESKVNQ